jgi:hypothetical protein
MFTAAECNAQQQEVVNVITAKHFLDADAQISCIKYIKKTALLIT